MSRKYLYPLLLIIVTIGLYYAEKYVDRQNEHYPDASRSKSSYKKFDEGFLPTSTTGMVINHQYYTLSYAEKHEQAEWVAYELQAAHIKDSEFERPYFVKDRKVSTGSAHWRNYKNSGYDRGHLVPAADREFDYNAYHETFLTSNISPQQHDFNGGIWNSLEQRTRYWAKKKDGLFVITGGVLKDNLPVIGDEDVSVPEEFYKILLDHQNGAYRALAFLLPNGPTHGPLYDYIVSIDTIEEKTGIDFFPQLPQTQQQELESNIDRDGW